MNRRCQMTGPRIDQTDSEANLHGATALIYYWEAVLWEGSLVSVR